MPSLFQSAAVVAFAGLAAAIPNPNGDTCGAAVTGKAGLYDDNLRKSQCASFIKTIVTPSPVVVTTTITEAPDASSTWGSWGSVVENSVTVCPNQVPIYASGCDNDGYKSACAAFGVIGGTTTTVPASTTTKTVYVKGGKGGDNTVTVTVTQGSGATTTKGAVTTTTKGASTTTSHGSRPTNCLTDEKAQEFVDAFETLLEYTSYNGTQGPPGRGYKFDVSAKYLAVDFKDYSDSINWMAGIPQGSVTFPSRAAFDQGQGLGQPELKVSTRFVTHSCSEITWGWSAIPPTGVSVSGINHMILTEDKTQIAVNYAEFNNALWVNSFHIPGVSCQIPRGSTPVANSTLPRH